jgi:hypothetical protein
MKKPGVIIAISVIIAITALTGCATASNLVKVDEFVVDLSTLPMVRNAEPGPTAAWADVLLVDFTDVFPKDIDWGHFNRFLLQIDYYDVNGRLIPHDNDLVMMTLLYDISQIGGNEPAGARGGDPGINIGNAAQKQFNLQGTWSNVHTRGCMIMLRRAPGGILLQTTGTARGIRFIEIKKMVFYNDELVEYEEGERVL